MCVVCGGKIVAFCPGSIRLSFGGLCAERLRLWIWVVIEAICRPSAFGGHSPSVPVAVIDCLWPVAVCTRWEPSSRIAIM